MGYKFVYVLVVEWAIKGFVEPKYIKILKGDYIMGKMVRFINTKFDNMMSRALGIRRPHASSIVELERFRYKILISQYQLELDRCEECGDDEGKIYYGILIGMLKDDIDRLDD